MVLVRSNLRALAFVYLEVGLQSETNVLFAASEDAIFSHLQS